MNKSLALFAMKKLLSLAASLFVIITLTFVLMKSVPGDPLTQEQSLPKEVYENLRTFYGLDEPFAAQYAAYLKNIATFDLGPSLIHAGRSATKVIVETFPVSGFLGVEALLIASAVGIIGGVAAALNKGSWIDSAITALTVVLLSIPSFILGTTLQYVFGIQCEWLPVARWESMSHTLLPALALASMPAAFLTKLIRANMIAIMKQDYIFLARAKGLPMSKVLTRHALRNALIPLFGYFGKMSANILVGSFIIEKIFCIPGLGFWFVTSISGRDYPMIMGLTIFYSLILLTALFIADIAHAMMDSRLYRREEALA